jgi:hypothetical protein
VAVAPASGVVVEIVIVVVVVIVVVGRNVELDRRDAGDFEVGSALGAAQLIALVDVEFVDFDLRFAFRARGHKLLGAFAGVRFGNGGDDVPESARQAITIRTGL